MAAAAVNDCSGRGDPAFHELQALLPLQFLLIAAEEYIIEIVPHCPLLRAHLLAVS